MWMDRFRVLYHMLYGKIQKTTSHCVFDFTIDRYPAILTGINLDYLPVAGRGFPTRS
jgi:hypothetical protein